MAEIQPVAPLQPCGKPRAAADSVLLRPSFASLIGNLHVDNDRDLKKKEVFGENIADVIQKMRVQKRAEPAQRGAAAAPGRCRLSLTVMERRGLYCTSSRTTFTRVLCLQVGPQQALHADTSICVTYVRRTHAVSSTVARLSLQMRQLKLQRRLEPNGTSAGRRRRRKRNAFCSETQNPIGISPSVESS